MSNTSANTPAGQRIDALLDAGSFVELAGGVTSRSTDFNESWDGTHKGQDCVEGSYVYVINYRTKSNPSKTLKKVGSILLLR